MKIMVDLNVLPDFENSPIPAITPEEFVRRYVALDVEEDSAND